MRKIKTVMPWNIKPGMLAEVPQFEHELRAKGPAFAVVESVTKRKATFCPGNVWKITFPNGTWPTATVLIHGGGNRLPAEKWRVLV